MIVTSAQQAKEYNKFCKGPSMKSDTTNEPIARCKKCGRTFLTLPKDHMIDRYQDKKTGDDPCGGILEEIKYAA